MQAESTPVERLFCPSNAIRNRCYGDVPRCSSQKIRRSIASEMKVRVVRDSKSLFTVCLLVGGLSSD